MKRKSCKLKCKIVDCFHLTIFISVSAKKSKEDEQTLEELKGASQPPLFSMPSKLLILHGEAKFEIFTIGCVPESMFNYLKYSHSDFLRFDMLRRKYNSQTLACKQKQRCG